MVSYSELRGTKDMTNLKKKVKRAIATTVGEMIKNRIEEMNVNPEDVCRGICTVSMLYKVERGEKKFKSETLALVLERLGMHNIFDSELVASKDYSYVQIIRQANQAILNGDVEKAGKLLEGIEADYDTFSASTKQRFDMSETLLVEKTVGLNAEAKLQCFEKIIKLTVKDYSSFKLPALLTKTEVMVLNVIANCYARVGDMETSISIHRHLKKYIENTYLDKTEAAKQLGLICYNFSKFLGLQGRYDECIEVAKQGIEYEKSIGSYNELVKCMYNCAWAMSKRGNPEDSEEAERLARKALILCEELEFRESLRKNIKNLINTYWITD